MNMSGYKAFAELVMMKHHDKAMRGRSERLKREAEANRGL